MRIFIGLTEVSGYYSNLKRGLDELGISAVYVSLYAHPFNYGEIEGQAILPKIARFCVKRRVQASSAGLLVRAFWFSMVSVSRVCLFIWALAKFDTFVLGGGSSFFRFHELPLIKLLGKRIVYMFHGTDSRPGYMDGFCEDIPRWTSTTFEQLSDNAASSREANAELDARLDGYVRATIRRRTNVSRVERYADVLINHPAHGHFHTRPFVPSVIVGLPYQVHSPVDVELPLKDKGASVRILHSPSQPEGKGTPYIRSAIERLRSSGLAIDYVEITGKPNAEVLAELARCDFVVDQAFSDYPMAAFALEAAFLGKPAVVGGYYADQIHRDIAEQHIPPSLFCKPQELCDAIKRLAVDAGFRRALGAKAQSFVHEKWTARAVASRYLQLINDVAPAEWLYAPNRTAYFDGIGQPRSRTRAIVREIVARRGVGALQLTDKPDLQDALIRYAHNDISAAESRDEGTLQGSRLVPLEPC